MKKKGNYRISNYRILNYRILLLAISGINLGFAEEANAFVVELFKSTTPIDSLEDADALIGGHNLESTASGLYEVVDFRDVAYFPSNGFWGHSDIDNLFPSTPGYPNINNFAVRATAEIKIPTADNWTFLTSGDDGVRLRIDGSDVIVDNTLHPTQDRLGTVNLSAGSHDLEVVLFEHYGVASLELWAAQGTYTAYSSSDFQLIGDTANGGIAHTAIPFEFSPSIGIILSLGLLGWRQIYKK